MSLLVSILVIKVSERHIDIRGTAEKQYATWYRSGEEEDDEGDRRCLRQQQPVPAVLLCLHSTSGKKRKKVISPVRLPISFA